ncbi:cytochrome b561 [Planctomycetales bacterium]|nr:cytochrome b561 [Planctomycetales bacterium]
MKFVMKQFRRLYDWILSWAETPYGSPALFVMAFAESSFFPIPPDVLQIALSVSKPARAFWYATVSLVGSVLGALLGYYIGYKLWETTQDFFFAAHVFSRENFQYVESLYHQNAFWSIFTAAFTPVPYKIFTIAAGVCSIHLHTLIIASIIGRGMRFYLVAALFFFLGPAIKTWIEKYFDILAIVFTVLLVGGFVAIKYLV